MCTNATKQLLRSEEPATEHLNFWGRGSGWVMKTASHGGGNLIPIPHPSALNFDRSNQTMLRNHF